MNQSGKQFDPLQLTDEMKTRGVRSFEYDAECNTLSVTFFESIEPPAETPKPMNPKEALKQREELEEQELFYSASQ